MKAILTGKQMRDADAYTIKKMGVPSLVLMERAALAVMEVLELSQPFYGNKEYEPCSH